MSKVRRVKYFTQEKLELINPKNTKLYKRYLVSRMSSNPDVKETTYKVYENYFNHFLVYLAEEWGEEMTLHDEEFFESAVDIMEGYMFFCQDTLLNRKKIINTKLSAVSSYFHWAVRRGLIDHHPFDGKLERMQGARDEKVIAEHFLTQEEVNTITKELAKRKDGYDIIDEMIWNIMIDSANRVGAISKLTISSLDLEEMKFDNIREKRGERVEVVFNQHTKEIIEEWLEMRKEMDNLEVDALFISRFNGEYRPMVKSTIQTRIKKIGLIIGVEDFRSHSIRKTALNLMYELVGDITLVAEMANHKSVETTQQSYIRPKSKTEIREELNRIRNSEE